MSTINTDLANTLGNLVSRTVAMNQKYFGGTLAVGGEKADLDGELQALATEVCANYENQMDKFQFSVALNEVFRLLDRANKYIDETTPWVLAKNEDTLPRLLTVMKNLCECIRISAILITPFMPETAEKIFTLLNVPAEGRTLDARAYTDAETATWTTKQGEALFPRLDVEKELSELEKLTKPVNPISVEPLSAETVDFDTFCKSDLRAVKVKDCQNVKKSDKLLQFTLDDGTGTDRQILSGIAKFYKPEDLIGKTLVAIVNLPPRKMMGRESCGMLISAVHTDNGEEKLNLLMVDDAIPAGAKLC
jgi:methionyl-tRNA synthetase